MKNLILDASLHQPTGLGAPNTALKAVEIALKSRTVLLQTWLPDKSMFITKELSSELSFIFHELYPVVLGGYSKLSAWGSTTIDAQGTTWCQDQI